MFEEGIYYSTGHQLHLSKGHNFSPQTYADITYYQSIFPSNLYYLYGCDVQVLHLHVLCYVGGCSETLTNTGNNKRLNENKFICKIDFSDGVFVVDF